MCELSWHPPRILVSLDKEVFARFRWCHGEEAKKRVQIFRPIRDGAGLRFPRKRFQDARAPFYFIFFGNSAVEEEREEKKGD